MLILLPPSESKRDGGVAGSRLQLRELGHQSLTPARKAVLASVRRLAKNLFEMALALRLGPTQHDELIRNRELQRSEVRPAIDRYTGVLYEALGAETLSTAARTFAGEHVAIHSALFGLLRADDAIPVYRLSHDSRLPGLSLGKLWRHPITSALAAHDGLVLDLRSEAYVKLGPTPRAADSFFVRVVSIGPDGRHRALNHFNKKGKGVFVRALAEAGIDHATDRSLLAWAESAGFLLSHSTRPGELELVV